MTSAWATPTCQPPPPLWTVCVPSPNTLANLLRLATCPTAALSGRGKNWPPTLSKEQGVDLTANDVLLGCGAAGVLNAFLRAVINPGEEMLVLPLTLWNTAFM